MATLTFNQNGNVAGQVDRSRSDGLAGKLVTVIASEAGELELLWTPLDDQLATLTKANSTTWTFEPADGVSGSYLVRFTPAAGGGALKRVFAIRTPNRALRKPALNEGANPAASLVNNGEAMVTASDFNEANPNDGSPFNEGNYAGWYTALIELFDAVESIADAGLGGPPSEILVQEGEGGTAVLALDYIPDGAYLKRVGNTVIGDTPAVGGLYARTGNPYIDPPTVPHIDSDEFDGGSAVLAERGLVLTSLDYPGGARVITERAGPVLWHDTTAGGLTDTQYRSTIIGSKLYLQLWSTDPQRAYTLLKPITQDSAGGFFAARVQGTIIDAVNEENGVRCNRFLFLEAPPGSTEGNTIIGIQGYYGVRRYLFVQYGAAGNGGNTSPLGYGEPIDYGAMDCFAANIVPAGNNSSPPTSAYFIQAASGYLFCERSFGNYTPAKMGLYLVPGSKVSRNGSWRIFEIDYIRRYPAYSWFGG